MQTEQEESTVKETTYSLQACTNEAARMLVQQHRTAEDVIEHLVARGVPEGDAQNIVYQLHGAIGDAKRSRAQKDMLYGALWCGGGTVLTLANTGFIFWGAIIFGAIQFFRGVANYNS